MPLTSFDPAHDGFSFPNNWTLSESEREALRTQMSAALERALALIAPAFPGAFFVLRLAPRLGREITGSLPDGYGLCGGMAFAALDAYREGGGSSLAAKYLERPAAGSELHVYLWRRLIESLALNAPTFLAWIAMLNLVPRPLGGGAPWLMARTREQVAELQRQLAQGQPVPIGLVGDTRDPFSDHQVLAFDLDAPSEGRARIFVYDMNCPGGAQTIDLDMRGSSLDALESCPGGRGPLRGLFCELYVPATPP